MGKLETVNNQRKSRWKDAEVRIIPGYDYYCSLWM